VGPGSPPRFVTASRRCGSTSRRARDTRSVHSPRGRSRARSADTVAQGPQPADRRRRNAGYASNLTDYVTNGGTRYAEVVFVQYSGGPPGGRALLENMYYLATLNDRRRAAPETIRSHFINASSAPRRDTRSGATRTGTGTSGTCTTPCGRPHKLDLAASREPALRPELRCDLRRLQRRRGSASDGLWVRRRWTGTVTHTHDDFGRKPRTYTRRAPRPRTTMYLQ